MEIVKKDTNKKSSIILIPDHCPNPAMINEFQTAFFTFRVNRLELVEKELCGYEISPEAQYFIADITIRNNTNEILSMFKGDFLITFDKEAPFEAEDQFGVEHQLPNEYALKPNEKITGKLVYIIARGASKISIRYTEYFDDDTQGKTYRLKYRLKA